METKKVVKRNSSIYDHQLRKLKARSRERAMKSNPIATGTIKAGPRIPTVVGMRQVNSAASQPKPSLWARA
jgi:hypothetical protein